MPKTTQYRPNLPPPPPRIARLPVDARGYPVPYFVAWIEGKPDHRVADSEKFIKAVKDRRCFICGEKLGQFLAFTVGPMCAVNRISSEPPAHRECAIYACTACPFLTTPKQRRREAGLPDGCEFSTTGLTRNPGVMLVWMTKYAQPIRGMGTEVLLQLGEPTEALWFCEGRAATRAEVLYSIETGLPALQELARQEGQRAIEQLDKACSLAAAYYP